MMLKTGRGAYALRIIGQPDWTEDGARVTLSLERSDGIERIALRCVIASHLLASSQPIHAEWLLLRLGSWLERDFEQTREAALKSIRSERKLEEFTFDADRPGPFAGDLGG